MSYSSVPIAQSIGEILLAKQIEVVVLSPGSRNAPLIIHLSGYEKFQTHVVIDERNASFFALGIAQYSKKAVCLCCTSGTALLNYAPAIAEAFYRQIPLVVISTDLPDNLIDKADGQSIRQQGALRNHIIREVHLSEELSLREKESQIDDILNHCIERKAPIHINIPFSEPLYGVSESIFVNPKITPPHSMSFRASTPTLKPFLTAWKESKRKMILVGINERNDEINQLLEYIAKQQGVITLIENTSNMHSSSFFSHIDQIIFPLIETQYKQYAPDFLLTIGTNIISKKIKHFLRSVHIKHHAHINPFGIFPDTYHRLTFRLKNKPEEVLSQIFNHSHARNEKTFTEKWTKRKEKSQYKHELFLKKAPYCDLSVFGALMKSLPKNSIVHLGNSSVVRYAQLFAIDKAIEVYSNRGTSGIEGCMSTALGTAISSDKQNVLIIGDLSFFYDSNALMIKDIPPDFRIVLINNRGGAIFQFIPGPDSIPNYRETFVAKHSFSSRHICYMVGIEFLAADNMRDLQYEIDIFFKKSNKPKLLEIKTDGDLSAQTLRSYFKAIK